MRAYPLVISAMSALTIYLLTSLMIERSEHVRAAIIASAALVFLLPLALFYLEFERISSTRLIAILAVLVATNVALRQALHGVGPTPVFFLTILTGYVFGPIAGFIMGSSTILVSNFFVGGHGPWSVLQMTALGFIGMLAAYLPSDKRIRTVSMVVYGFISGFFYGFVTDIFSWLFFVREYTLATYLAVAAAGLGFNIAYGVGNALLIILLSKPVILILERFNRRLTIKYLD